MEDGTVYLGDGLYARFDGYQIRLWTVRNHSVHEVFLDTSTLARFEAFVANVRQEAE